MPRFGQVCILRKRLIAAPAVDNAPHLIIAACRLPEDVPEWLSLRERAFTGEEPPVRRWSEVDFLREFASADGTLRRPTWLARPRVPASGPACGAVSVSVPESRGRAASLHWLMVDCEWRRRGVGTRLLQTAERYCWDLGWRELRLETHLGWKAAVRFYGRHSFQEQLERGSPRERGG